jgi:glycosyltransferase involved in cell wall biosynthesis
LNVGTIIQVFYTGRGFGGEVHADTLRTAWAGQGRDVRNVAFYDVADSGDRGWRLLYPGRGAKKTDVIRHPFRVLQLLREMRPEVVISHTQVAAFFVHPVAWILRVPKRINVHHLPLNRELGPPFAFVEMLFGSIGVYTDVVMVAEAGVRSASKFPARYRRKIKLIRNQVPPLPEVSVEEARSKLGLPDDDTPILAFVGRRTLAKGADVAAKAAAHVDDCILLMAGEEGDADEEISAAASGNADIRLLGRVDRERLSAVMTAADVLVFPSQRETRPLSLLEAASKELPIVASDIQENREAVGDYASYVAGDDPIRWAEAIKSAVAAGKTRDRNAKRSSDGRFESMIDEYVTLVGGNG